MQRPVEDEEGREVLSRYFHDKTPPRNPDHQRYSRMLDQAEKELYDLLPGSSTPPDKSLLNVSKEQFREMGYFVKSPDPANPPRSRRLKREPPQSTSKVVKSKVRVPKASKSKISTSKTYPSTSKISKPSKPSKADSNHARRKLPVRGKNTQHRAKI
ncbi:hypothetical protein TWF569_009820 [Orbilia oligospora]|uniref:Uncharacterized protein n=1 Tax=Orbilia oligospora TaxID=2813651 RepID=A0A7C8JDA9_ORBOL|nr:hypothetical protein TWF102_004120 [Orbilia oligospora]KAF3117650.1 hypothetical protein TWF103_004332 [Orbilia oligospora]KAF3152058.1 hypothetical protein TWF594_005813 [Orbilia oligospora]KAF3155295.1 hypothetical protein TWF569_009820 [Orbilia oligospora]